MVTANDQRLSSNMVLMQHFQKSRAFKRVRGIDPFAFRQLALKNGFKSCEIHFDWFLGNAKVLHQQGFEHEKIVMEYLQESLPISKECSNTFGSCFIGGRFVKSPEETNIELSEIGFIKIPNVLLPEDIDSYRHALVKANRQQDDRWKGHQNYIDGGMVHNPMIYDPIFLDFLANPIINDFLEQHFDPYCILYAFTTSSMPPGGTNFSNRIHVDCPRHIPNYPTNMGILVAIDEFTLENGAPYY